MRIGARNERAIEPKLEALNSREQGSVPWVWGIGGNEPPPHQRAGP